jgi:tRNA threonylcarbamoyladenosine biosynthesis protein TsaB
MPSILAIETATEACSAALYHQGKTTSKYQVAPQLHANLILFMCDELLRDANLLPAQLSAIAFGRGPGSFTGVRIATAVAQGIGVAHDLPLIPVSTLQALAQAAYIKHQAINVLAGIDARMQEIYWSTYGIIDGLMQPVSEEIVAKAERLPVPDDSNWFGAGSAWRSYKSVLLEKYNALLNGTNENLFPSADAIIPIALKYYTEGNMVNAENTVPVYLRDNILHHL